MTTAAKILPSERMEPADRAEQVAIANAIHVATEQLTRADAAAVAAKKRHDDFGAAMTTKHRLRKGDTVTPDGFIHRKEK